MSQPHLHRHVRRNFLAGTSALGAASLLGVPRIAAAEPPPEVTRIRIHESWITCLAPQIVAQELLHFEGFKDVQYVKFLKDTQRFPPEGFVNLGRLDERANGVR